MRKFVITESEKNDIRRMYGLIKESDDDDIISYIDYYLKSKSCDEIAVDMKQLKSTQIYTDLSKEEKSTYDSAIIGLNNPGLAITSKGIKCDVGLFAPKEKKCKCVKDYMKSEFLVKLSTERQKVINQICAFSTKFPPQTPLNVCKKEEQVISSTDSTPAPSAETPVSTDSTPAPSAETPVSTDSTPVSTDSTPAPGSAETPVSTDSTPAPKSTETQSSTEKKYSYQYPGDKNYRYAVSGDNWWAKNITNSKEFELTGNDYKDKFQVSIDNLDRQFPNARPSGSPHKKN